MDTAIRYQVEGHVATITIDRPDKKNALTRQMYVALLQALDNASGDSNIRMVLLRGAGGIFSSGNDLQDFLGAKSEADFAPVLAFLEAIHRFAKPLVAAVEGLAIGIGATLLLHCDLVYATSDSTFQMPFTRLGLVPEAGATYLLPRLAGHRAAAECLFFGAPFDANTAKDLGLVGTIVPKAEWEATIASKLATLAALPAEALILTKALLKQADQGPVRAQMAQEAGHFATLLHSPQTQATIAAFFKKK